MKGLDIKATIYDIFGYLIPGTLLIVIVYYSYKHTLGINPNNDLEIYLKGLDTKSLIFFIFISYCIGHTISALSSLVVEKLIVFKAKKISSNLDVQTLLSSSLYSRLCIKFKELYNTDFTNKDFRLLICFNESKQPNIYSTAFTFLAFYGMARSLVFISSIGLIWELYNSFLGNFRSSLLFVFTYLFFVSVFYYQYYRFLRYYREQICMGFLI
jgi:hypothetical protein